MVVGFWLVNLFPPGEPQYFSIQTSNGIWNFERANWYDEVKPDIEKGSCANTYSMEMEFPLNTPPSQTTSAFDESLPICLAASFITGAAVTVRNSTASSFAQIVAPGSSFPRSRGIMGGPGPLVKTLDEFKDFVERFCSAYSTIGKTEKLLLLIHFYLDALSCWSLEDMYLSGSTLLQIIAATEEDSGRTYAAQHASARLNNDPRAKPAFFDFLAGAANRVGIPMLSHDVVKIRNSLIHEGTLNNRNFPDQEAAAAPIADAFNWFDQYIFAVLGLATPPLKRFKPASLSYTVNSFSFPGV